jgi:hypothetical protein
VLPSSGSWCCHLAETGVANLVGAGAAIQKELVLPSSGSWCCHLAETGVANLVGAWAAIRKELVLSATSNWLQKRDLVFSVC